MRTTRLRTGAIAALTALGLTLGACAADEPADDRADEVLPIDVTETDGEMATDMPTDMTTEE